MGHQKWTQNKGIPATDPKDGDRKDEPKEQQMDAVEKEQIERGPEEETEFFLSSLGSADVVTEAGQAPTAPEVPKVAEPPKPAEAPKATDNTEVERIKAELAAERHKNKTLQGMISKSETQRLREELESLRQQVNQKPAPAPEKPKSRLSDEDFQTLVDEVGEKAANIQRRLIDSEKPNSELADVRAELEAVKGKAAQLEQATAQTAAERYYTQLNSLAPDWQNINGTETAPQDERFTAFALQTIPGSDETYDDALKRNHARGNAAKVAEIFNLFKQSIGQKAETTPPPQTDKEEEKGDDMITEPERTGAGTPPPADKTAKKTYTQEEVDKFDKLYHTNKLTGDPKRIEAMWDELQLAIFEGRVR